MPSARLPKVFLLLACTLPTVAATGDSNKQQDSVVFGEGNVLCGPFVYMEQYPQMRPGERQRVFAWVEGYFSARNMVGHERPLAVGNSVSSKTRESMLLDLCGKESARTPIWVAADKLYNQMQKGGI